MVFKFYTAFALGLIAMVAGTYLVSRARTEGMCCKGFSKLVGWFVIIAAFLCLISSTIYSVSYMKSGYYCQTKMGRGKPMMHRKMDMPMMKDRPMMKRMMEGPGEPPEPPEPEEDE